MFAHTHRLSTKIVTWFFLNVLGLLLGALLFVQWQSKSGLSFIAQAVTNARLQEFAEQACSDLNNLTPDEQAKLLSDLESQYEVNLALYTEQQEWISGTITALPELVAEEFPRHPDGNRPEAPPPFFRPGPPRHDPDRPPPPPRGNRPQAQPNTSSGPYKLFTKIDPQSQTRWAGAKVPFRGQNGDISPTYLLIQSSLSGGKLFFNSRPWIVGMIVAILASILFWIPLVISLERRLKALSNATDRIAAGELATRVVDQTSKQDEIATLGRSVNRMATQLEQNVKGQKRFLGDIAHELASPIARMQAALALLERNVSQSGVHHLEKLDGQVQHMGQLINELLLFSKASLKEAPKRQVLVLAPLLQRAIESELPPTQIYSECIPQDLRVKAVPSLLERATANILRNSVRYGGPNGKITITAERKTKQLVTLIISDDGPGVAEEDLPRLFEAFYRPTRAREAESGGTGLGLAIVKSCIESCKGRVEASNLTPHGFEIRIELESATEN
ncbi:MAG: HAMP domain-containing protein [Verrucomicrobia bacterium]|jgi:two-component system, OmpR family, sensor histidine kinase CpxA|nr:HAMP domain-containing protein [Verrucomicrobiota bacterium]